MELLPTVGLILDNVVCDVDNYFIVCEVLITVCFHNHYHAYEVSHDTAPSFFCLKQSQLADHSVLGLYNNLVSLKYHVVENTEKGDICTVF